MMIKFSHMRLLPKAKEESEKGTSLSKLDMKLKNPLLFGFHLRFLGEQSISRTDCLGECAQRAQCSTSQRVSSP